MGAPSRWIMNVYMIQREGESDRSATYADNRRISGVRV